MTDTYGLSAETLERAAEAIGDYEDTGYDPEQIVRIFILPALPVLAPALREALVREMWRAANSKGADVYQAGTIRYMSADTHWEETAKFIKSFLPAAEEPEQEGAR